jgi:hypothetical protein
MDLVEYIDERFIQIGQKLWIYVRDFRLSPCLRLVEIILLIISDLHNVDCKTLLTTMHLSCFPPLNKH